MVYIILASCIVGVLVTYPLFYNIFIFPKEMDKFNNYIHEEQSDLALSILNNLPEKKKTTLEVHLAFADAHIMKKHWYLSLFHLNEIIEKKLYTRKTNSPTSKVSIHLKKATIYENIDKVKNAIAEYFHILKASPKHLVATTEIGMRFFQMKNYIVAVTYLEESYSQNNKNPKVSERLCEIYIILENYDKALTFIQQAIRHSTPVHCRLRHKEIICLFNLKRYPETLSVANSIEKTYSKTSEIEIIMGMSHFYLGETEVAEKLFTANLSKYTNNYSPNIIEARYLFSEILLAQNNFISALVQMSFIQKGHKAYKDNDERSRAYTQIVKDKDLNSFFSLRNHNQNNDSFSSTLSDVFIDDGITPHTPFQKLSSNPDTYIAKAEITATHEKIFISVNASFQPFHNEHAQKIINLQNEEHQLTGISVRRLFCFSIFEPLPVIFPKLKEHFSKTTYLTQDKFFETIKNKKLLLH